MAMSELERDLRLALEKCERMLARVRAEQHLPGKAAEEAEKVERMLRDLSPSAGRLSQAGRESESSL